MTERLGHSKQLALVFLLGALLVGGVVGFTADRLIVGDRFCPKSKAEWRAKFHEDLGLTAAQAATVDSLLDHKHEQIAVIMKPVRPQLQAVSDSTRTQISRILTPAQQARFEEIRLKAREKRQKSDGKK